MENKIRRFLCFSPSASSSSETVSDMIKAIREEAGNSDLDAIIQRLCALLEAIKTQQELQKKTQRPKESQKKTQMPTPPGFLKLKDLLSEGVNGLCSVRDALPAHEVNQVVLDLVKGLGQAHWVTSCFLLVSYILDRFETLSSNQEGCLDLLEHMYYLAVDLKEVRDIKKLGWEDLVRRGTKLIVEASLMCCTQIDLSRPQLNKFFTTTVDAQKLSDFKAKLATFNEGMVRKMGIWTLSSLLCKKVRPAVEREELHPVSAVGIEEPLKSVTKLLHLESKERAVAVIVHGLGGIGKTTLANAVFARYYVKDCKYSVVMLGSSPDIVTSQKDILRDLMKGTEERKSEATEGDEILHFEDYIDGRRKIGELLQREVAFIYIDNVVDRDSLQKLLPTKQLKNAKKLRVLITTRDLNVLIGCNMKQEVYAMNTLSTDHGRSLLIKEMYNNVTDDINGQITDSQLEKIVELSGGIPNLLKVMAGFIQSAPDKNEAYCTLMQESEELTGNTFCDIDKCIFAYDDLPDECKNPFLDICYFFEGWEWETVANIVGESALDVLERRALVSNDNDMIRLHDVILRMGKVKAQDTRFDFTRATAGQIEEFFEKDMQYLELVKGLWFSDDEACKIPITKLNSMRNSLRVFGHKMQQEESFEKMERGEGQREPIFHELLVYKGESPHCPFKWSGLKKLRFLSYRPENLEVLREIPSKNLKHIELDGSLCSVSEILSSDIQQLRALQVLRLINFHNLEKLPEDWGEYLRENLKELTLSHCTAMTQLPGSISQLTGLKILKLDNCCNLRWWPKDCESLSSSLKKIILCNCPILKSLPSCFVEALDSDSRRLFQHKKGILSDSPQSNRDED